MDSLLDTASTIYFTTCPLPKSAFPVVFTTRSVQIIRKADPASYARQVEANQICIILVMGKIEQDPDHYKYRDDYMPLHGHITALTVAPQARRNGLGKRLSEDFEMKCAQAGVKFIDLFVREGNNAVNMYKGMG